MDLFSAANIFLKLRDDLTVSARRKRLFNRIFKLFYISSGKKITGSLKYFFSKLVHRKGCFGEIEKNSIFRHRFSIFMAGLTRMFRLCQETHQRPFGEANSSNITFEVPSALNSASIWPFIAKAFPIAPVTCQ